MPIVTITPNDDQEEYLFMISGAVCARQAYDGIRVSSDDADYDRVMSEILAERTRRALLAYATGLGPIYA